MRQPRKPRQPRQPRGGNAPSSRYRVANVAPTGDWPVTAMVSAAVTGFGTVHAFCIEEELGRPTLGVLTRWIERSEGRQLELEALAALAAIIGSNLPLDNDASEEGHRP
jgi:hypothetical protein